MRRRRRGWDEKLGKASRNGMPTAPTLPTTETPRLSGNGKVWRALGVGGGAYRPTARNSRFRQMTALSALPAVSAFES